MAVIVIMGVSGAGKSVVGARLAGELEVPFCEGDDLHSAGAIAKMKAGLPLDDADRAPWLARIASWIAEHSAGGVVSCSALRRRYRDRLRNNQARPPIFVLLNPPRAVLERRLSSRVDHFMPASLLDTQLKSLELPSPKERVLSLEQDALVAALVEEIVTRLQLPTAE